MAEWLNQAFETFDFSLMQFGHNLHLSAGGFFDGFFKYFTMLGDGGIFLILLSICLVAFKKTRKVGVTMLGAIFIGAIFTNLIIKPMVARPRPYVDQSQIYYVWWQQVGAIVESEFSFPSGHTTAAMSAMMAFFLAGNKKYSWTGFLFALLMGFSRIYLCVHYPSDVLFGFIIGIVAGSLAYLCVWLFYKYTANTKFGDFVQNKDVIDLYKFIKNKYFNKNKMVTEQNVEVADDNSEKVLMEENQNDNQNFEQPNEKENNNLK